MRRGLISWSREEVPAEVLESRLARLQERMRRERLDAVLAYTSFCQPSAVQWLCHFVPYWSEAMLAVLPQGAPQLYAALTRRVHPWIREVSHLGEVVAAPRLGPALAAFVGESLPPGARVGVVGLERVPASVMGPLAAAPPCRLVDAGAMFAELRQPADTAELALARRARDIAVAAIDAMPAGASRTGQVLAAAEGAARMAGAEEVLQRIAPDLSRAAPLRRMEGQERLGERYAIELSVAYKGVWVRVAACIAAGAAPIEWAAARQWLAGPALSALGEGRLPAPPVGRLARWSLESCLGMDPLAVAASDQDGIRHRLPPGSLAVLSVQLDLPSGGWHGSLPVVMDAGGATALVTD